MYTIEYRIKPSETRKNEEIVGPGYSIESVG